MQYNKAKATHFQANTCIHKLFEEQVERSPDQIAIICKNQQLTYKQLNTRANQLAHHLQAVGVAPEVLIGLYMERSLEVLIGILGIRDNFFDLGGHSLIGVRLFTEIEKSLGRDLPLATLFLDLGWGELVAGGNLEIHHIPGDHYSLLREPLVQVLAEKLQFCLKQARADGARFVY